jgi:hypothetical protein
MTYDAFATMLSAYPLEAARALMVSVLVTAIGPSYLADDVVGVEPSEV